MEQRDERSEIEIVYDPRTLESDLPIRKAAALTVCNTEGKVLIVRRSQIVDEFKGAWSLPSSFIDTNDENIAKTIQERLRSWLDLEVVDICLIGKRMGIRPKWRLLMHLFLAESTAEPSLQTDKYDSYKWVDGVDYFSQFRYEKLGECTKAYLDYMNSIRSA